MRSRSRAVDSTRFRFYNRLEMALELMVEKKAAAANKDEFECEKGCGFRAGFDEVARHEETCRYVGKGVLM